jgi:hypothetical protein
VQDYEVTLGDHAPNVDVLSGILPRHAFEIFDERVLTVRDHRIVLNICLADVAAHRLGRLGLVEHQIVKGGDGGLVRFEIDRSGLSRPALIHRVICPAAVKANELGAVCVQDIRRDVAPLALPRTRHNHEAACAHVVHVMLEMFRFLSLASGADQRALDLGKEAMAGARRIQPVQILLTVQNVDIFRIETGVQQRFDGGARLARVRDRTNDTLRWVRDELAGVLVVLHVFFTPSP